MAGMKWADIAINAIRTRADYSVSLTHWTKQSGGMKAFDILKKILDEKVIRGSTTASGFIKGDVPATCFTETPVTSMGRAFAISNISEEANNYLKWEPYGLAFMKPFAYQSLRARPVFYVSDEECDELFPRGSRQLWRVVRFDQSNVNESVDFLHEREWRAPGDIDLAALNGEARPLAIVRGRDESEEIRQRYLSGDASTCVLRGVFSLYDLRVLG